MHLGFHTYVVFDFTISLKYSRIYTNIITTMEIISRGEWVSFEQGQL